MTFTDKPWTTDLVSPGSVNAGNAGEGTLQCVAYIHATMVIGEEWNNWCLIAAAPKLYEWARTAIMTYNQRGQYAEARLIVDTLEAIDEGNAEFFDTLEWREV